ncbi:hypothetical protein HDU98_011906 [Podochytrium sp. JEL0797]|nr:hypothetical protein HDU98_011906 [Podochytrium sp. JEL0797]
MPEFLIAVSGLFLLLLWFATGKINLRKEIRSGIRVLPMLLWLVSRQIAGNRGSSIEMFMKSVRRFPNKAAIVFTADNRTYTFKELNLEINRAANWLRDKGGAKPGSIVALMLDNSPEFIILWMACLKIGVAAALINPNSKGASLVHILESADPSCILFSAKYAAEMSFISQDLNPLLRVFVLGVSEGFDTVEFGGMSESEPDLRFRNEAKVTDAAVLIYTSGTTGKPKPATITHARLCFAAKYMSSFADLRSSDRIYTCLPLYHSAAALIGWGSVSAAGCTMILAPKFSASKFFKESSQHNATVIQYIGELARFLLSTPPSPFDTNHTVRIAVGNGLRPDVWTRFKSRFAISEVCEFYASTEGNANMVNHQVGPTEGVGAVARMGPMLQMITQIYLVKFDAVNEVPVRDERGRCVVCKAGEVGELVAAISKGSLVRDFRGYHNNEKATNQKILTDVFRKGDRFFRTGDLLMMDKNLYYYFVDRIGDSFRWKGENVSTCEVSEVMSAFPGISEANVYGVKVPGAEGCAGMAAIHVHGNASDFTGDGLAEFLGSRLPKYAIPVWIRVLSNVDASHTITFKQMKVEYRAQGFNLDVVRDALFWMKPGSASFTRFKEEDLRRVMEGGVF